MKCMSSSPRVLAAEILAGSQNWQTPHDLGKRDRAAIGTCLWNWWLFFLLEISC